MIFRYILISFNKVNTIAAGHRHTLGVKLDGTVFALGDKKRSM